MSGNKLLVPKWKKRTEETHREHQLKYNGNNFDIVFLGDSMMERWTTTGKKYLEQLSNPGDSEMLPNVAVLGIGGDAIENLLYRLQDERCILDQITINKCLYLMIGTNNLEKSSVQDITEGISNILHILLKKVKVPIKVLLLPYRSDVKNEKVDMVNQALKTIVNESVTFHSVFDSFTFETDYDDHVHFNESGYQKWYNFFLEDLNTQ